VLSRVNEGMHIDCKPNYRFKPYYDLFMKLTKSNKVSTQNPLINCAITYDSQFAITVTKKSDREYYVKQYNLESYELTFEEKYGGQPDSYIKMKEIQ
jgi:hypothetical protein